MGIFDRLSTLIRSNINDLISQAEYQAQLSENLVTFGSSASDVQLGASAEDQAGGPMVEVILPDPLQPLAAPINIEIRFHPDGNAQVDVSTFRVLYGMLRLDVTRKLLSAPGVVVSATGIHVSGAQLPKGKHRFLIEIADRAGHIGRRLLEVSVTG